MTLTLNTCTKAIKCGNVNLVVSEELTNQSVPLDQRMFQFAPPDSPARIQEQTMLLSLEQG